MQAVLALSGEWGENSISVEKDRSKVKASVLLLVSKGIQYAERTVADPLRFEFLIVQQHTIFQTLMC